MKLNRMKTSLTALFAAMLLLSGCADIKRLKEMEVGSVKVENISPHGFRGAGLTLSVEVDNPGAQVSLSEIFVTLEHSGKVLGKVAVDPFTLQAKTADTYTLDADVTLGENATLLDLGKLLDKKVVDEASVDISAKVRIRKGAVRKVELNDIPLKKLMETVR